MVQTEVERQASENEKKTKSATSRSNTDDYQDKLNIISEGSEGRNESTLYSHDEYSSNSSDSNKSISSNKKRREYIKDGNSSDSSVSRSNRILSDVKNSQREKKREATPAESGN
ncbi:hypothetical protein GWI33_001179 [Rhynchophorus ferrugineus]|uniref:Uncharacterized protein n=1 Tax=Rhynchophorus ferrugineus TaxID=354439 RepID=A0A834HKC6_RHYFE|nr:hypothetical protein GWI33_001179 [Rhynchophorus ferrugineus]